ncbi:Major facilitator superfamily domain, general substrate transporter [Moelleriella libera RCEF 2490]|uniref:Major facilitator superfamily domain, general substrate transporter n=1 Tax=Moelleriella libera RCEF 2490 TaxID=1081109 RepID=A0A168E8D0_9HYPO|nr:Major facilitator superfamily domain, general substrate transporter [Moelleriella libera RCEF 2490]
MSVKEFFKRRSLRADDSRRTRAAELTLRQSLYPICLVSILFFLWGFSYGLLDTLNKHFQNVLGIDRSRSAGLQAAYFGAYPLASIGHAAWILRHYGYKAVFIWGLCLYALGGLLAIAALKAESFGGFCACIFIIGNGLGSLETAANPYITVCGPPRYSEIRINFSQAFNGVGTVIAPVLGSYVFFTFDDKSAQANVQWVYLAIAVFVLLLAVVFYFSDIPEITDADMEFQARETHAGGSADQPFWKQWKLFHAAFAQFCYTGAQIAIASFFINYTVATRPGTTDSTASKFFAGAQAAFAIGRFAGVGIMKYARPRWVFLIFLSSCVIFLIPSITERGNTGMSMLYVVLFFESICFPTIVALGMRGLGRHTKRGSGYIVGGVIGGACVPPATGAAADHFHRMGRADGDGYAMFVPLIFMSLAWIYAACVNFVPAYRDVVDSLGSAEIGITNTRQDEENAGPGGKLEKVLEEHGHDFALPAKTAEANATVSTTSRGS